MREQENNVNDSVKLYLKEISQYPLLTPEEEHELCKKVAKGDYEAKQTLINSNLRLVVKIAKLYARDENELLDYIQEGNLGLMRAIEKFDHELGYKISTYATWWIRQAIARAFADKSRTIRIPVHMQEQLAKFSKTFRNLAQELGREPSTKELADEMALDVKRIEELMLYSKSVTSLDETVNEEDDSQLLDFIPDEETMSPEEIAECQELKDIVEQILQLLTERERFVITHRFGIDDNIPKTLDEIGQMKGVTRERIRQIEAKALKKLKVYARRRALDEFIA